MRRLLLLILAIPFVCSCDNEDGKAYLIKPGTFVQRYYVFKGVLTYSNNNNAIWLYEDVTPLAGWYTANNNSERFRELSEKHGDMDFGGVVLDDQTPINEYFDSDFSDISITSDSDFNETHPAGTLLNDIAKFITITPSRFIKSGYTNTFDWDNYEKLEIFNTYFSSTLAKTDGYKPAHITLGRENIFPVYKTVKELAPEDMTLLGRGAIKFHQQHGVTDPFAVIEFTEKPTLSKSHKISVILTTDNGVEFAAPTVELVF